MSKKVNEATARVMSSFVPSVNEHHETRALLTLGRTLVGAQ